MTIDIKIEDNVPIPDGAPGERTSMAYPWPTMQVGQSFFVPKRMKNPTTLVARAQLSTGFKFSWRRLVERVGDPPSPPEEGQEAVPDTRSTVEGVRFWRVS